MASAPPLRRSTLALFALLLGLVIAPFPEHSATASCAAPSLRTATPTIARGSTVTVEGRGFVDGGDDGGDCSTIGCADHCDDPAPEAPFEDVELRLVQGGRSWSVGRSDASSDDEELGRVTWEFVVPRGLEPGPARLDTEPSGPTPVRIR